MANKPREVDRTKNIRRELAKRCIIKILRKYTRGLTTGQINAYLDPDTCITYRDVVETLTKMGEERIVVYEKFMWKIPRKPGFWVALGRLFRFLTK